MAVQCACQRQRVVEPGGTCLEVPRKWKCTGQAGGEESAKGQPEPGHPGLLGAKSWGRSTHPHSKLALLRLQKEAPGIQKAVTS